MTTYQWSTLDPNDTFSNPSAWASGTLAPPQGPPGTADTAQIASPVTSGITVTGSGTVAALELEGTVTLNGASLSATTEEVLSSLTFGSTAGVITLTGSSTLSGPMSASNGLFTNNITFDIEGASTVSDYGIVNYGTMLVEDGSVTTTIFEDAVLATAPGFNEGTVDIGALGTVTDTQGTIYGTGTSDNIVTVENGGKWSNQGLDIVGSVDLTVSGGSTVSVGNGTASAGAPALYIGDTGTLSSAVTITVTGTGSALTDAGNAVIGDLHPVTLTVSSGGSLSILGSLDTMLSRGGGPEIFDITGGLLHVGGNATLGDAGDLNATISAGGMLSVGGAVDIGGGTAAGGTGIISLEAGGTLNAAATTLWNTSAIVLAGGTLSGTSEAVLGAVSGFGEVLGAVANSGTVTATGGVLTLGGAISGSGTLALSSGTLDLRQGVASTQTVTFEAGAGRLQTESLGATAATIEGFTFGDSVLLTGALANAGTWAGGVLTLEEGTTTIGTLAVAGAYTANNFAVSNDGTNTTIEMACFATGTGITTIAGRVAVEDLRIGDRVPTLSGCIAEVRWIGHRALDLRRHPKPQNVMPVRVRAGAFGEGVPGRDLVLSPDHAVLVDETLIPVRHLINGISIVQETRRHVTYWHVELDRHDVLLAEGLAAESYLDTGNRHAFEGEAALDLHPDFAQARSMAVWNAQGCAAIATAPGDPRLRAAHTALLARAGRRAVQKVARLSSIP